MKKKKAPVVTLRQSLAYEPAELTFGTSGLRGLVKDITNLEAYVNVRGFLAWLIAAGDAAAGAAVYTAGDLRPSTSAVVVEDGYRGDILQAVWRAVTDAGMVAVNLGHVPTPALSLYALERRAPSIMVTGSHIPFDRNGIKFTRPGGEVMKEDERPILAAVAAARKAEYDRPFEQSRFDDRGMLRPEHRVEAPAEDAAAAEEYVRRYTSAFPAGALAGTSVLVWEHSAVGRDLLARVLSELGARVVSAGRSDSFVPVDTEAVTEEMLRQVQALADGNGGPSLAAVVSTDGDSDRPLVFAVREGRVSFIPGDLLGLLAARWLGVRHVAVPVSVNDAVDESCRSAGIELVKTKIGSPHVISALKEAGWEGNGGFLTGAPLPVPGGSTLRPLPTRDAVLPILCGLASGLKTGELPRRFGRTAVVRDFPMTAAVEIVRWLAPAQDAAVEAMFSAGVIRVRDRSGAERQLTTTEPLAEEISGIHAALGRYFPAEDGFDEVSSINWVDGVRVRFASGDVVHFRPSGNAPEMRFYTVSDTPERAGAILERGISAGGTLRRMARDAADRLALSAYKAAPQAVSLHGAVQHYAWGGYDFIPQLLGQDNPGREPCAELWLGAHPRGLAQAEIGGTRITLDRLIAFDPWLTLGSDVALRHNGRLPYLFKVLDVREMLSVQAHPSRAQAEQGFARENAAGIPLDAPQRVFRDENHKPEVHVALTEFWMLHGFRPLEETVDALSTEPELAPLAAGITARLAAAGREPEPRQAILRELYGRLMEMAQPEVDGILDPLLRRLETEEAAGRLHKEQPGFWAVRASRTYGLPGGHRDRGIFSIYLLNLVKLRPGQGTFQPPGVLHAYLEGANVELMANSDNVLRGGLTPKHVDVAQLLATVSFRDERVGVLEGRATSETSREYETPADEFALERIEVAPGVPYSGGREHSADSLVCIEGAAAVIAGGRTLAVTRGSCALVPANLPYSVAARGPRAVLFKAGVPAQ
ncbi:MAG TPA: mannose-6-phosphate isomerase, class I [Spirochaetia bacterium]|nr:mannose-6-phosphate isomerase, class I [Spirochaetia bacterium]